MPVLSNRYVVMHQRRRLRRTHIKHKLTGSDLQPISALPDATWPNPAFWRLDSGPGCLGTDAIAIQEFAQNELRDCDQTRHSAVQVSPANVKYILIACSSQLEKYGIQLSYYNIYTFEI